MIDVLVLLIVAGALIAANGFFVAAEFAMISTPRPIIEKRAREGNRPASMLQEVLSTVTGQDRFIATAQLGLSLVSLGLGMYAEHEMVLMVLPFLQQSGLTRILPHPEVTAHVLATGAVLGVLTVGHIVLGEMVPKSIALALPEKTALSVVRPMHLMYLLFYPVIRLLNIIGNAVLRLFRLPLTVQSTSRYTRDELRVLIDESAEEGLIVGHEHQLMKRVILFGRSPVSQVMVARTRIVALAADATVDEALQCVVREVYTRYPVYGRDKDDIVGFVHVKDLLRARRQGKGGDVLQRWMRAVPLVPESMEANDLFARMQAERVQMAVVLDEYGGTAGMVTMEDLVEEIFGEVRDEFDTEEPEPITRLQDGSVLALGDVALEDLADVLECRLDIDDVETLNGLVTDRLGRPARRGDRVEVPPLRIAVEEVRDLTVGLARVWRSEQEDA